MFYFQVRSHPTIETCAMRTIGPYGEIKMSTNTGPTTQCQYQSDFYGNFQPVQHHFKVFATYVVDTSMFPPKTGYIESYNFGITDLTVNSVLTRIGGKITLFSFVIFSNTFLS